MFSTNNNNNRLGSFCVLAIILSMFSSCAPPEQSDFEFSFIKFERPISWEISKIKNDETNGYIQFKDGYNQIAVHWNEVDGTVRCQTNDLINEFHYNSEFIKHRTANSIEIKPSFGRLSEPCQEHNFSFNDKQKLSLAPFQVTFCNKTEETKSSGTRSWVDTYHNRGWLTSFVSDGKLITIMYHFRFEKNSYNSEYEDYRPEDISSFLQSLRVKTPIDQNALLEDNLNDLSFILTRVIKTPSELNKAENISDNFIDLEEEYLHYETGDSSFSLEETPITFKELQESIASYTFHKEQCIGLSLEGYNGCGDIGKIPNSKHLKYLNISFSTLSIKNLTLVNRLPNLEKLTIDSSQFNNDELEYINDHYPDIEIVINKTKQL